MRFNTRFILEDCIDRGIEHALMNMDDPPALKDQYRIKDAIQERIWLYMYEVFTFDEDE